jgi:hypothetical protein
MITTSSGPLLATIVGDADTQTARLFQNPPTKIMGMHKQIDRHERIH